MKKKIYYLIMFLWLILLIFLFFPIVSKTKKTKIENDKIKVYEEKIRKEKEKNERLKLEIESIREKNNIEKNARETLNMGKKGEKVYIIIENEDKKDGKDR